MVLLVFETNDFILDGRTVSRTDAFDSASVERRAVEPGFQDAVRLGPGGGEIDRDLFLDDALGSEGKRQRIRISGLGFLVGEIDAPAVHARRRAGL